MVYISDHPSFKEMKQIMERGLTVTDFDKGDSSFVFFSSNSDASRMATAVSSYGEEAGTVRQFLFDKGTGKQQGADIGVVLKKGERPMPTPRGQFSLFCVKTELTRDNVDSLLPELKAAGKVVDLKDNEKALAAKLKALGSPSTQRLMV